MPKVSIIDYGMSNLLSIARAFEHVGAEVNIIQHPEDILQADYLVLPGVGAFPDGMRELETRRFPEAVRQHVSAGKPLMGVCLGMQMLLSQSHEHTLTKGLDLIKGEVLPLPKEFAGYKVPNINWHAAIKPANNNWERSIFRNTSEGAFFYFVHSYYAKPGNDMDTLAQTRFGDLIFSSAVQHNNVMGTQFHPEKSGEEGLTLLRCFLEM